MLEKDKPYIESACSAGILGLNSARTEIVATYNPYKYLTREQFVMVMSRLLYGDRYDNTPWEKSYKDRLATLMQAGFLKNPDGSLIETYVNVLTFLKRVAAAIPSLHVTQPKPVLSDGNDEMHVTYRRAKNNEITSIDTYTEAALYAPLTRQEMAKMLVMFSKNIVHKAPQENSICTIEQFTDYTGMTDSTQIYVKQACQL